MGISRNWPRNIFVKVKLEKKQRRISLGSFYLHFWVTKLCTVRQEELFIIDISIVFVVKIPKFREKKNNTKTQK